MNEQRKQLFDDLRDAVLSADFGLNYANTVVETNQYLDADELKALSLRYRNHGEEWTRTAHLVDTFNRVAAEEMAAFEETALAIIDEYFRKLDANGAADHKDQTNPDEHDG